MQSDQDQKEQAKEKERGCRQDRTNDSGDKDEKIIPDHKHNVPQPVKSQEYSSLSFLLRTISSIKRNIAIPIARANIFCLNGIIFLQAARFALAFAVQGKSFRESLARSILII